MSNIDIVLAIVLVIGAYSGYKQGFLMGLFTLLALVLGVMGAFALMGAGMEFLQREFNADRAVLPYISFLLIFIAIVVGVTWLGKSIRNSIDKSFLGHIDEAMGALLGMFKTAFTMSVLLWITDSLKIDLPADWTRGSWLYPFTARLAPELTAWISQFLPFLKDIFAQF